MALAALGAGGAGLTPGHGAPTPEGAPAPAAGDGRDPFRLGVAGYTFNKFNLDQTLEMLQKVDAHYLCIKDFHLPLESTDAAVAAFHAKCAAANVTGYGVGPIYMGSEAEVNRAFEYARRVGVKTLVGVPFKTVNNRRAASPELLRLIDARVREFDLRYAIHNHGPDMPDLFPSAESAMELIGDLDHRVGLCLDIGHQLRDGKDPIQPLVRFPDRIHDIHLKNVTAATKAGRGIELPRGVIDIPAFVRALRKAGYRGVCSLEYEKDMANPLTGIAECIGYFRGVMDATR
jgi:sugar phosphate isomerase/epimerase